MCILFAIYEKLFYYWVIRWWALFWKLNSNPNLLIALPLHLIITAASIYSSINASITHSTTLITPRFVLSPIASCSPPTDTRHVSLPLPLFVLLTLRANQWVLSDKYSSTVPAGRVEREQERRRSGVGLWEGQRWSHEEQARRGSEWC